MEQADAQAARPALVNYEAEQAVLSALLADNGAYDRVCDFLAAEHFADAVHGRIYAAIAAEIQRGSKANAITLKGAFDSDPALPNVGGGDYLYQLQNAHVASLNARHYGAVVYDLSRRRALVSHLRDVLERAETADVVDDDADAICGDALESLDGIQQTGAAERTQRPAVDVAADEAARLDERWKAGESLLGVTTGFRDLDDKTSGLVPGEVTVLAARPSMGKTTLASNIALKAAEAGHAVQFYSLEMSAGQLGQRCLAYYAGEPYSKIRSAGLDRAGVERVQEARFEVPRSLHMDDKSRLTPAQMQMRARRIKRKHGLSLVIVDHLGYVAPPDPRAAKHVQLGDVMKGLQGLAKSLDVPVLVLCQLARASQHTDDRRPELHHLRESGQIEEDADAVWFVHREYYYLARQQIPSDADKAVEHKQKLEDKQNVAEVIVAKQRNGPVGTVETYCDMATNRMEDLAGGGDE